jgi:serine protease Do
VIGVNTAIASTTGFNQGYAFAIPANLAARVMRDLIRIGHVQRPMLGVQIADVTAEDAQAYGLESIAGARIEDFPEQSPAADAGLERHDMIVALDGRTIDRVGQLQRLVALHSPGDTVRVEVVRWGKSHEKGIVLGQAPIGETADRAGRVTPPAPDVGLGFEVADLDETWARQLGLRRAEGVIVSDVVPWGPGDRKGLARGDQVVSIGRTSVRNAREARNLLRAADRGDVVTLLLKTAEGRTYVANIRIP